MVAMRAGKILLLALVLCIVSIKRANAQQVMVSDGVQLAAAMMDLSVKECVLTSCGQYTMSQGLFAVPRTLEPFTALTIRVAPHLSCRPLLNFNYTTDIFKALPGSMLKFTGVELYQMEHGIPSGLLAGPGALHLRDVYLHNEVGLSEQASYGFFSSIERPTNIPGKQQYETLPAGWCQTQALLATNTSKSLNGAPCPQQLAQTTGQPDAYYTRTSLQKPPTTRRMLHGAEQQLEAQQDPDVWPYCPAGCPKYAGQLIDVAMITPVLPDGIGGYIIHWVDSVIFSDEEVSSDCLRQASVPDCMQQALKRRHGMGSAFKDIDQQPQMKAAGPLPTKKIDTHTSHSYWVWVGPVLAILTIAIMVVWTVRAWWLSRHAPHELQGCPIATNLAKLASLVASNNKHGSGSSSLASTNPTQATQHSFSCLASRAPEGLSLGRLIGAGSFGRVYQSTWHGQQVAVKILMNGSSHEPISISPELDVSESLSHTHVVRTITHFVVPTSISESVTKDSEGVVNVSQEPTKRYLLENSTVQKTLFKINAQCSLTPDEASSSVLNPASTAVPHPSRPCMSPEATTTPSRSQGWVSDGDVAALLSVNGTRKDVNLKATSNKCQHMETWIVMELCTEGCLAAFISSGGLHVPGISPPKLDMGMLLSLLTQIASGMTYLHSQGIIHSDLKSENVLLTRPEVLSHQNDMQEEASTESQRTALVAKVADFGLSRVLDTGKTHVSTRACGTISHCPPELILSGQLRPEADVYAFGMLMYEMAVGVKPFSGQHHGAIVQQVVVEHARPQLPPGLVLPPKYVTLMEECWAQKPEERPTCAMVSQRLTHSYELLSKN